MGYSCFLVYDDDFDDIMGVVYFKVVILVFCECCGEVFVGVLVMELFWVFEIVYVDGFIVEFRVWGY